jgi:hypothetical protein
MESNDGYILVSLHILQTIPKSTSSANIGCNTKTRLYRVLLVTIRDKGACPCPRCLVTKEELNEMGLKRDLKIRENKCRYLGDLVQRARNLIYKKAAKITGAAVNRLLKPTSSVPTVVSRYHFCCLSFLTPTPTQ